MRASSSPDSAGHEGRSPSAAQVRGVAIFGVGLVLFVGGISLLALARARPDAAGKLAGLAPIAIPAVLVGGVALCIGLGSMVFGWGPGASRASLPPGSHRSVVATTMLAIVAAVLMVMGYLAAVPAAMGDGANVFAVAVVSLYGSFAAMIYLQGVRCGLISPQSLGLRRALVREGTLWGLVGALAILALAVLNGVALQIMKAEHPQLEAFRWLEGRPFLQYVAAGIGVAVVAPIVEELFFRGYVFNAYLVEKGRGTAYLASSLIFGAVHGLATLFIAIFGMGLVLAYLYRRTGTIIAPVVAHGLNNGLAFAALLAAPAH